MGIFIALRVNLTVSANQAMVVHPLVGAVILVVGFVVGLMEYLNAVNMGITSAASINLVAKQPDQVGRSILFPALVETYAVVALLMGILMVFWITG
jgi:V/A-type H+/Na+-transporting ATPase subunit K